jgi:hypothetical protein
VGKPANKCEFALDPSLFRRGFHDFCRTAICHARPLSRLRPSQQCRAHKKSKLDRSAQSKPSKPLLPLIFFFAFAHSRHRERAVLKLMFGALTRAAERWKSIKFSEFERRQLSAAKKELDQEYEAQVDLSRKASKGTAQSKISSSAQT